MNRTKTYFISDAHLGASYIASPRAQEQALVAFLASIEDDAKAVYLLGDVLDYWFEYRTVVPKGYTRFFGQLARMADAGIKIVWFTGNHDIWLRNYFTEELGVEIADPAGGSRFETIDGTLFYLAHGDNLGRQPATYRFLRSVFRCRPLQKLFSAIHPRWTVPFAHRWSSHSRKASMGLSELAPKTRTNLEIACRALASANPELKYIVIGHHHVALCEPVGPWCRLVVLGQWIDRTDYAVFDGQNLALKSFTPTNS